MLTSIISGGAAGAERGALRAAIDLDIGCGGWRWCDDEVPEVYTSRMRLAVSRAMQRRLNVQDSDATLFVMRTGSKEMKFIVDACRSMRKPAKTLVLRERRGDACSSQRIVSDGANPSPDTCDTCGARPGESHPGNADDFSPNGVCPKCGAWASFTEGGTDA